MFLTENFTVRSYGSERWHLVEPLCYEGRYENFEVPAGWFTDFASVPQIFTWLIPRYGVYTRAAILHDYLSDTELISRRDADGIFRRVLRELGVGFTRRWMMWAAVRAASGMSNASPKEITQFTIIALLAIPFLLIPTVVLSLWMAIFKLVDIPVKAVS